MTIPDVPRETRQRLDRLREIVVAEAQQQNLIAASTIPQFDERHIDDSLQLLPHVKDGPLLDIGSGGGFPGLALACSRSDPVHLVEPRTKRAEFLSSAVALLDLGGRVEVHMRKVEQVRLAPVATITARAVASLDKLFAMAAHLTDEKTRWVLPKGRKAASELEEARRTWQGSFRLVPSMTDPDAAIVIAEGVRRRPAR
jgi:16S rRNA (guanine527-N7)-methyltransferase